MTSQRTAHQLARQSGTRRLSQRALVRSAPRSPLPITAQDRGAAATSALHRRTQPSTAASARRLRREGPLRSAGVWHLARQPRSLAKWSAAAGKGTPLPLHRCPSACDDQIRWQRSSQRGRTATRQPGVQHQSGDVGRLSCAPHWIQCVAEGPAQATAETAVKPPEMSVRVSSRPLRLAAQGVQKLVEALARGRN
jgi:hypothetical protein